MRCPNCNKRMESTWVSCPYCGCVVRNGAYRNHTDKMNSRRRAQERRKAMIALFAGVVIILLFIVATLRILVPVVSKRAGTDNQSWVAQKETETEKTTGKATEKAAEEETERITEKAAESAAEKPAEKESTQPELPEKEGVRPEQAQKAATAGKDGTYILSRSSDAVLTYEMMAALSEEERQMAINEIYARHGRRFNDSSIQAYFDAKSWYNGTVAPEDFSDSVFSQIELENINLLSTFGNTGGYDTGEYTGDVYADSGDEFVGYYVDYERNMELYISDNGDGTYSILCYYEDGTPWKEVYDAKFEYNEIGCVYAAVRHNAAGNVEVTSGINGYWGNFIKQ